MLVEQINKTKQNKLFMEIDKRLSSVARRNVSYNVMANGPDVASITVRISGRQGTISKNLVLIYRDGWELYYDSYKIYLDSFSDIAVVIKKIVTNTTTIVSKL